MRAFVAGAIVAATTIACKNRDSEQSYTAPPTATTAPTAAATDNAIGTANEQPTTTTTTDPFNPPIEQAPDVIVLGVDTTLTPGAAKSAPPPDPFVPAIESVRSSALGCFASLPPGTYAATIVVRVTPAGTPIDVQVEPGNVQDPSVLGCLRAAGEGRSYPSSQDGRTLRVYVRVAG